MVDGDVVLISTENVEILHINFSAPTARPVFWRSKSLMVNEQSILLIYIFTVLDSTIQYIIIFAFLWRCLICNA